MSMCSATDNAHTPNNAILTYFYRDGSNYKRWGEVTFSNVEGLPIEIASNFIRNAITSDGFFIASQIRLPEVFLTQEYPVTADDHCFHEFDSLAATDKPRTDRYKRSLQGFISELQAEARRGWVAFDVHGQLANDFELPPLRTRRIPKV